MRCSGKGKGARSSTVVTGSDLSSVPKSIVVTASADGVTQGTFTVPLSTDPKDNVKCGFQSVLGAILSAPFCGCWCLCPIDQDLTGLVD